MRNLLLVLILGVSVVAASAAIPSGDAFAAEEHYSTRGIVKSFGPKGAYVNIAHEAIPNYMGAMTMSFEPRAPEQLAGVSVGAHVAFTFTVTSDGRRLLDRVLRE